MKFPWIIQRRSIYDADIRHIRMEAHSIAMTEILELLKQKDKIYLDTTTIVGDGVHVDNCAWLGCDVGVKIIPSGAGIPAAEGERTCVTR